MNFIKEFINNTTPDGWLSVIGSLLGFLGILLTIKYTKKQFERDKKLAVKPYLDVRICSPDDIRNTLECIVINKFEDISLNEDEDVGIKITNLGQGHCLKCKLIEIKYKNTMSQDKKEIGNIKINETALYNIYFYVWYGDVLKRIEDKYKNQNINNYDKRELSEKIKKETQNKVELLFEYEDVLGNRYNKKVVINIYMKLKILHNTEFEITSIEFESLEYELYEKYEKEVKS